MIAADSEVLSAWNSSKTPISKCAIYGIYISSLLSLVSFLSYIQIDQLYIASSILHVFHDDELQGISFKYAAMYSGKEVNQQLKSGKEG